MTSSAYTKNENEYPWEYEDGEEGRNDVIRWRTLLSGDKTPTNKISMGTLELPSNTVLRPHHHAALEVYYITNGEGVLLIGKEQRKVKAGDIVYIPCNLIHGIKNLGQQLLTLVWMFPTDTWSEIVYQNDDNSEFVID